MHDFQDKVAVVTGAARGIGKELAERLFQHGMKAALADIEESALMQTCSELRDAHLSAAGR